MIVPYDVNFDEKVDRAAENLVERGFESDLNEARQKARIVLLVAMRVEAEHFKKEVT